MPEARLARTRAAYQPALKDYRVYEDWPDCENNPETLLVILTCQADATRAMRYLSGHPWPPRWIEEADHGYANYRRTASSRAKS